METTHIECSETGATCTEIVSSLSTTVPVTELKTSLVTVGTSSTRETVTATATTVETKGTKATQTTVTGTTSEETVLSTGTTTEYPSVITSQQTETVTQTTYQAPVTTIQTTETGTTAKEIMLSVSTFIPDTELKTSIRTLGTPSRRRETVTATATTVETKETTTTETMVTGTTSEETLLSTRTTTEYPSVITSNQTETVTQTTYQAPTTTVPSEGTTQVECTETGTICKEIVSSVGTTVPVTELKTSIKTLGTTTSTHETVTASATAVESKGTTTKETTPGPTVLSTGSTIEYPSVFTSQETKTVTETTYQAPTTMLQTEGTTHVECSETGTTCTEIVSSVSTTVPVTELKTSLGTVGTTTSTRETVTATATTVETKGTNATETTVTGTTSEVTVLATGTTTEYPSVVTSQETETVTKTTYQTPSGTVLTEGTKQVESTETGTTSKETASSVSTTVPVSELKTSIATLGTTTSSRETFTATASNAESKGTTPTRTTVTGTASEATVLSTGTTIEYPTVITSQDTETVTQTTYQAPMTTVQTEVTTQVESTHTGTTSKLIVSSGGTTVPVTELKTSKGTVGTTTSTHKTTAVTKGETTKETTVTGATSEATVLSTGTIIQYPTVITSQETATVTQTTYQAPKATLGTAETTHVECSETGTTCKEILSSVRTTVPVTEMKTSLGTEGTTTITRETVTATETTVETKGTTAKETTGTGTTSESTVLSSGTTIEYPNVITSQETETLNQTTYRAPMTTVLTKGTTQVERTETGTTSKEVLSSVSTSVPVTELKTSLGTEGTTTSIRETVTATATAVETKGTTAKETTVTGTTPEATVLSTASAIEYPSVVTSQETETVTETTYRAATATVLTQGTTQVESTETGITSMEIMSKVSINVHVPELKTSIGTVGTATSTRETVTATETTVETKGTTARETTGNGTTSEATVLSSGTTIEYPTVITPQETDTVTQTTYQAPMTTVQTEGTTKVESTQTGTTSKIIVSSVGTTVPVTELKTSIGTVGTTTSTHETVTATATTAVTKGATTNETTVTGTTSEATILSTATTIEYPTVITSQESETLTQTTYQAPMTTVLTKGTTQVESTETGTTSKEVMSSVSTSVPVTEIKTSIGTVGTTTSTGETVTATATTVESKGTTAKEITVTGTTSEATVLSTGTTTEYPSVVTSQETKTVTETTYRAPTATVLTEGTTQVQSTETGITSMEIMSKVSINVQVPELKTSIGTVATTTSTSETVTGAATTVETKGTTAKETTGTGTTPEATVLSSGRTIEYPTVVTSQETETVTQTTYQAPMTTVLTEGTTQVESTETRTTSKEIVSPVSTTGPVIELKTTVGTVGTTTSIRGTVTPTATTVETTETTAKETTGTGTTSEATVLSIGTTIEYPSVITSQATETVTQTTYQAPTTTVRIAGTTPIESIKTGSTTKEVVSSVSSTLPVTELETSLGAVGTSVSGEVVITATGTTVKTEGNVSTASTVTGTTYEATVVSPVQNVTERPPLIPNVEIVKNVTVQELFVPQPCLLRGKEELLTFDVDLVLLAIDSTFNPYLMQKLREILTRIEVQKYIAMNTDFTMFQTQAELLRHVLSKVSTSDLISAAERPSLQMGLRNVRNDGPGARPPTHRIICIDIDKAAWAKMRNETKELIKILHQRCIQSVGENLVPVLRLPFIMTALRDDCPETLRITAENYFNRYDFHKVVTAFDFFAYKTRKELLKNLLIHLSQNAEVPTPLRDTFRELIKYVKSGGESDERQVVYVDCDHAFKWSNTSVSIKDLIVKRPKPQPTTTEAQHSVPSEASHSTAVPLPSTSETPSSTQWLPPNISVTVEACAFSTIGVATNVTDFPALIDLIPPDAPVKAKVHLYAFLTQGDLYKKLENFDVNNFSSGTELLQKLLVHIWLSYTYEYETKEAAKLLLPFVQENGPGAAAPSTKIVCINPATKNIISETCVDTRIPGRHLIEVTSKNPCFYMNLSVTAVETYRLHSDTIVKTLSESAPKAHVAALLNFLRTPQSQKYLTLLNVPQMNTNNDFVDALLSTLSKFKHELPKTVTAAVTELSAKVRPTEDGGKRLYVEAGCKVTGTPHDVLVSLLPSDASHEIKHGLTVIGDVMGYSNMSVKDFLPWISDSKPHRKLEVLECVLLHLQHHNPDLTPHTSSLLLYIRDKEAHRLKEKPEGVPQIDTQYKTHKTALNKTRASFKIDYPDLLKIIRPNASREALNIIMDFFISPEFETYIENFNPINFTTQGALLNNIFKHLLQNPRVSSKVKRAVKELEPYIDYEDLGSLPPTIHKVYVKTKTEVNIVTLDFSNLFKALPRKSLSAAGKAALDAIFKYLSSPTSNVREILRGVTTQQKSHLQLKIILLKLKQLAGGTLNLGHDIDIVLEHLHKEMKSEMSANAQTLPNLDWLGVLSSVPDEGMPPEVLAAKKDLYWFFISRPFRQDTVSYLVDTSQSRAVFLKEILNYVRMRFEDKTLNHAVAYVAPFLRKDGPGAVPISYDEILPEEEDEAVRGEARLKELLYQMPGMLPASRRASAPHLLRHLRHIFPATRRMQRGSTYIGLDVLDELPPREQLLVLLRRVRHNYRLFIDDSTVAAINAVLSQMREAPNDNAPIAPPLDLARLQAEVLGEAPPQVRAAMAELVRLAAAGGAPSLRAGQDLAPSLRVLEPRSRLAVALHLLWRAYTHAPRPADFQRHRRLVRTVYEYLRPDSGKGTSLSAELDHKRLAAALRAAVGDGAPPLVREAVTFLTAQLNATRQAARDPVLQQILSSERMPQRDVVAHALRRYRSRQPSLNPKLWSATTAVLRHLKAADDDSVEVEEDISVVNAFKELTDVAGEEVAADRDLVLRFLVDHRTEVDGLFRGYTVLRQYSPRDRIALLLQRVKRIFSGRLDPPVTSAIDNILHRLGTDTQEVEPETIDAAQLLESVTGSATGEAREAATALVQRLRRDAGLSAAALHGAVVQRSFNPQRRAALLLRRLQRRLRSQLSQSEHRAVRVLLHFLNTSPDSSLEDQFVGTVHFGQLFARVFERAKDQSDDVQSAQKRIVELLESGSLDLRRVLRGIHMWKLDPSTRVSLILYRLLRVGQVSRADAQLVHRLLSALDSDVEQAAAQDRDESRTPERLFSEALRSAALPDAVAEARAVLTRTLRRRAGLLYRGVHFEKYATPVGRLTAMLRSVWLNRDKFPRRVHQALKVMTKYLHIKIAEGEIDPYTFDFDGVFDVAVSTHAPEIVQQAKSVLLNAIKKRPALFKKLLTVRVREGDSEHQTARAIVAALSARKRQLSMRIRTALSLLTKFLQGQQIDQNDPFLRNMLTDSDYHEAADYDRHFGSRPVLSFRSHRRF